VFDPDVEAVSSATLNRGEDGALLGNAQMIASWIVEETKGDCFQIQTAYTYPSDYDETVSVGEGQDIDFVDLALATHLEDVSGYDTVWLVAPVWHYTVCTPLRAFLEETDLSGKKVYVMTTHCGSRFADTVEKIQQLQPNATVVRGVAVSGFDPGSSETEVREYVRSTIK
jgi:flavodoxin